jgi:hypothetical protein
MASVEAASHTLTTSTALDMGHGWAAVGEAGGEAAVPRDETLHKTYLTSDSGNAKSPPHLMRGTGQLLLPEQQPLRSRTMTDTRI